MGATCPPPTPAYRASTSRSTPARPYSGASCFWPSRRRTLASSNKQAAQGRSIDSKSVGTSKRTESIEKRERKDEREKIEREEGRRIVKNFYCAARCIHI